jgi:hypothetical protein
MPASAYIYTDTEEGSAVQDPPTPSEEEHEQDEERRQDEDAMRYPGHEDPDKVAEDDET